MTFVGTATPGSTQKLFAYNASGQVWNGAAYVSWVTGNYSTYKITADEGGEPGSFYATIPAGAARWELVTDGVVAAHNDNLSYTPDADWFIANAGLTTPPTTSAIAEAVRDVDNTSPAAGSLGAGVNAVKAQTDLITSAGIIVISPFAQGSLTIRRGDSYGTTSGQTLTVPKPSGASWPTLTNGWTITLTASKAADNDAEGTATLTKACVVVDANTVRVDLLAADTTALALGLWKWELQGSKALLRNTLISGPMRVLQDLATA